MALGLFALAVVVLLPLPFLVTFPVMAGVLAVDLLMYFVARNRDSRVPENMTWSSPAR